MKKNTYNTKLPKKRSNKKGIYYTLDALLAGMFLIGVIFLIMNTPYKEERFEQKTYLSQDLLNSLSELKLNELNADWIKEGIDNGSLSPEHSVLEQMGEYWSVNETALAKNLLDETINYSLLEGKLVGISFNSEQVYNITPTSSSDISTARRTIAGISKGNPITGFSSSAYLKKIRNKKTSSYAYFGGFTGQGNISVNLYLPSDFNSSKLITSEIKAEIPGDFYININSVQCGNLKTGAEETVQTWSLSGCSALFNSGKNNISLIFNSPLNKSYVSGGYIRAIYTTDTLRENYSYTEKTYEFPEINGMINIYDAVSAQGFITDLYVNLNFYSEYDTYLALGNETYYFQGDNASSQHRMISKTDTMISTTFPIRFGVTNLSNLTIPISGSPTDSILVTDVSGSMNDCSGIYYNVTYCNYQYRFWIWWFDISCTYSGSCSANECNAPGNPATKNHYLSNQSICKSLLTVAKEADILFVNTILNQSLAHKIGLDAFSTNANDYLNLTNNNVTLAAEINTYASGGSTCACCGINRARTMVNSSTSKKYIIFLSDGEPNQVCSSYTDYTGSDASAAQSISWAVNSSRYACSQNITVYTIGFGNALTASGHSVLRNMSCNSTSNMTFYYNATDASQLAEIYRNISNDILLAANFSSQTLTITGNFTPSRLFTDSYINMTYIPFNNEEYKNMISLTFESPQFNSCNSSIEIPENIIIKDASVTSFSGPHWTKELIVNNEIIYNLSIYNNSFYDSLGDPFQIQVPSTYLISGLENNLSLSIGDSPSNYSDCSDNNTFIYTALINSTTKRISPLEYADGCRWTIESIGGGTSILNIPYDYSGPKTCSYTNASISYNTSDAYDQAMYLLMLQLDPNMQGRIIADLEDSDLEITITTIGSVPYMWGPALAKVEVTN
ncbi:MAG: vWA domain-containing protein [Candidatus Nanoarchaeia archaeon]